MGEDGDRSESHAAEVAVGVADEDLGWVAVGEVEGGGDGEEWEEDVEGEKMGVGGGVGVGWWGVGVV